MKLKLFFQFGLIGLLGLISWSLFTPAILAQGAKPSEPFKVTFSFDEKNQATLRWTAVPGAKEYCIDANNEPDSVKQCAKSNAREFPLTNTSIFGTDIKPTDSFFVTALDAEGKEIVSQRSESVNNDLVVAKTEFGNFADLGDYAGKIMQYALPLGIALSIIMSLYAGIRYMLSQGQPDKVKEAHEVIQGAVLGLIVLIMARYLVNFLFVPTTGSSAISPEVYQAILEEIP